MCQHLISHLKHYVKLLTCGDVVFLSGGNPYKALMSIQQIIIINKLFAYQTFVVGMWIPQGHLFRHQTFASIRDALWLVSQQQYSSKQVFWTQWQPNSKEIPFIFSFKNCMQTRLSTRTFLRRKYYKIDRADWALVFSPLSSLFCFTSGNF